MPKLPVILCIPGLGGHASAFGLSPRFLPEYELRFIELTNREKAFRDALEIIDEKGKMPLLCNSYGVQMGLKLIEARPGKITHLVLIEPFFAQFSWWRGPALAVNKVLLWLCRVTDAIGLRRRHFTYQPDYVALARYPIYVQPLFDMWWQNLTDYFDKIEDILTFRLPAKVEARTLILLSPYGFTRDKAVRAKIREVFYPADVVELADGTHNVTTILKEPAVRAIHAWLQKGSS
jgi:pimeloyl-ACP methyl ester carboxylesterase